MSKTTFDKLSPERKERILSAGIRAFSQTSYKDVSTDTIIQSCQISKGILFHYFGSKKAYYLTCLQTALDRLMEETKIEDAVDFYEILFSEMNRKMEMCQKYPNEMYMVNMASRDPSQEIMRDKTEIIQRYMISVRVKSEETLQLAMRTLKLKNQNLELCAKGLHLYINALLNRYLLQYQHAPDLFFRNSDSIKNEMKTYLDLMLYGMCNKEEL